MGCNDFPVFDTGPSSLTPAPEPPEVEADELAAAEEYARALAAGEDGFGGTQQLSPLLAEFDRRAGLLLAYDTATSRLEAEVERLAADLARALPVVEAAGAVVADWSDSDLDDNSDHPLWNRLDALAHAYRAAREPRTGEQG